LRNNDTELLSYYYKHYDTIDVGSNDLFSIPVSSVNAILNNIPFTLHNCIFTYDTRISIVDADTGVMVCVIDHNGNVRLVDGNGDLSFLLRNIELFTTVYKESVAVKRKCDHEHRRPKIRRRRIAV
jgi:hypothetical protein